MKDTGPPCLGQTTCRCWCCRRKRIQAECVDKLGQPWGLLPTLLKNQAFRAEVEEALKESKAKLA